jgi:hypothetical protein
MNAFGIAALSPFRFRFRLDDGFVAGFIRLYSLLALSLSLSISSYLFCLDGASEDSATQCIRYRCFLTFLVSLQTE